jgi:hypothetical protein
LDEEPAQLQAPTQHGPPPEQRNPRDQLSDAYGAEPPAQPERDTPGVSPDTMRGSAPATYHGLRTYTHRRNTADRGRSDYRRRTSPRTHDNGATVGMASQGVTEYGRIGDRRCGHHHLSDLARPEVPGPPSDELGGHRRRAAGPNIGTPSPFCLTRPPCNFLPARCAPHGVRTGPAHPT